MTTTLAASQLATPPRPPIPVLERPLAPAALEEALRAFHGSYYVQHPFHQLMYEGKLSQRQFQGWVANRLAYQRVVPRKDAAILSNCPDPDVRREWIGRIIDHDGTEPGTGGIELWIRLGDCARRPARGDGGRAARAAGGAAHLRVVRHVLQDASRGRKRCASSLTELFAPKISSAADRGVPPSTIRGFRPRRSTTSRAGWCRPRATVSHGLRSCSGTGPRRPRRQQQAFEALAFKLEMLWAMIDTIHNAYREA